MNLSQGNAELSAVIDKLKSTDPNDRPELREVEALVKGNQPQLQEAEG
jgi:hypothetical protein